ncbi:MAG: O-antigen ligase family protein, partial [Chloroflexi bacterium]|nr:O-antigen ligase family protein [Chloroflexota bacterium]
LVLAASVAFTNAGGRTVSVFTEADKTVDVVTDPGNTPTESEIRSRGQFWTLAVDMAIDRPLTGVGPFQWNVERYERDPGSPVVLADAHQTYLQLAAEYGLVVAALYVLLLTSVGLVILWRVRSRSERSRLGWAGMGIVLASAVIPLASLTNSHIINPRNGPLEWLLLGAALALALGPPTTDEDAQRARGWM